MLGYFPNIPPQQNIRISRLKKRLRNHYKKKIKSKNKSTIENLTKELYQLESEHAKGAKLHANIILELEDKKCSKTYLNVLQKQYAKSNNF